MRLDQYLSEKAGSRSKARDAIEAGQVQVNGKTVTKAGFSLKETDTVHYEPQQDEFVSRAGGKLLGAIREWNIDLNGAVVLDIGASTGGFTQCCLEHGASKVYALDVGHLQLSQRLKDDERVVEMEGVNARTIQKDWFDESIDFVCMDVSFISCKTILEPLLAQFHPGSMVILIKPQFECGKSALNKHGVLRNEKLGLQAAEEVKQFLKTQYDRVYLMASPVVGRKGNQEYLAYCFDLQKGEPE